MSIKKIKSLLEHVKLYEKGTTNMWTDDYISKQLLDVHLSQDINAASRKEETIIKTLEWIMKDLDNRDAEILDLGCGPGLYTEKLADNGYRVTGVDFSYNSIRYARERAEKKGLQVSYICENYLNFKTDQKFDLIMLIYCDFGVLSIDERVILLKKIYSMLKPGGVFIFDALNKDAISSMKFEQSWEFSEGGFWREQAYVRLSESKHLPKQKAILNQHVIITEDNDYEIYRFWNHYFNENDVKQMIEKEQFSDLEIFENMLDNDGSYNDKGVTFYKVIK